MDIGCGTGDNSIFLVKNGFSVICLDIAHLAIEKGKVKAARQKVRVDFRIGDALRLDEYFNQEYFNAVVDSGLFHTLSDHERPVFAKQIRRVLVNGGKYFMLCFSDKEPGNAGPRRISKKEIEETFSKMFRINYIKEAFFATASRRTVMMTPNPAVTTSSPTQKNTETTITSSNTLALSKGASTPTSTEIPTHSNIEVEAGKHYQLTSTSEATQPPTQATFNRHAKQHSRTR